MVRLKERTRKIAYSASGFQFLYGAIKSGEEEVIKSLKERFQFLYGAIKRVLEKSPVQV